jgi:hypothetical protein
MRDSLTRLTWALASMGLSHDELRNLFDELRMISPELMIERVNAVRHLSAFGDPDVYDNSRVGAPKVSQTSTERSVGERVAQLLKVEAHFGTQEAAHRLRMKLIQDGIAKDSEVPELHKKALNIWVDRLARAIPAKELLRCATIIRNERVHSPAPDWSIRTGSK